MPASLSVTTPWLCSPPTLADLFHAQLSLLAKRSDVLLGSHAELGKQYVQTCAALYNSSPLSMNPGTFATALERWHDVLKCTTAADVRTCKAAAKVMPWTLAPFDRMEQVLLSLPSTLE